MYKKPPFFTSTMSPSMATIRLIRASPDLSSPTISLNVGGGLKTTTSLRWKSRHLREILSTVSWSPMSKVGYIDKEGMNRGSTKTARIERAIVNEVKNVFKSSCVSYGKLFHFLINPSKGPPPLPALPLPLSTAPAPAPAPAPTMARLSLPAASYSSSPSQALPRPSAGSLVGVQSISAAAPTSSYKVPVPTYSSPSAAMPATTAYPPTAPAPVFSTNQRAPQTSYATPSPTAQAPVSFPSMKPAMPMTSMSAMPSSFVAKPVLASASPPSVASVAARPASSVSLPSGPRLGMPAPVALPATARPTPTYAASSAGFLSAQTSLQIPMSPAPTMQYASMPSVRPSSMTPMQPGAMSTFDRLDTNHDGSLSRAEFMQLMR
mmetsp:Transcript_52023/g.145204  ORF Transcript_52023/g.145204 Transcript_52023/m.145204 type:complete len:378 (-) Transcript_52023:72-1205(-)